MTSLLVDGGDFTPAEGLGTELWGCAAWDGSEEEQLSLSAPNPLPQELSLSAGPGTLAGNPPSSGSVSY